MIFRYLDTYDIESILGENLQYQDIYHNKNWQAVMGMKDNFIMHNKTWSLQHLPPSKKPS